MLKHESRCTLNPNRKCGVCDMIGNSPEPVDSLIAFLPDSSAYHNSTDSSAYAELYELTEKAMPALRTATDNCPACIMAALRQANIPVPMVGSFNFKAEMKEIFSEINSESNYDIY